MPIWCANSGQLLFDGRIWRLESAQSQFCRQIVHRYLSGSIFASKPVPDGDDPAFPQLPTIERAKALGFKRVVLETSSKLEVARYLYRSFGFKAVTSDHLASRADEAYALDL